MTRVQGIIVRDRRIPMARHRFEGRVWWCLPGGSIVQDETPEEAVIRELKEECCVDARVIQRINTLELKDGEQSTTFLTDIGKQEPRLGHDPEFESHDQPLTDLEWLSLEEISERDRVFLWASGLLAVGHFADEVQDWGDDFSCPGRSNWPQFGIPQHSHSLQPCSLHSQDARTKDGRPRTKGDWT